LVYFKDIWSILLPFGTFYGYLVYFSRFGMMYEEKSGNPAPRPLFHVPHPPTKLDRFIEATAKSRAR
jgi:hypothetical protein